MKPDQTMRRHSIINVHLGGKEFKNSPRWFLQLKEIDEDLNLKERTGSFILTRTNFTPDSAVPATARGRGFSFLST